MKTASLVVLLLFVAGCSKEWKHETKTKEEFIQDNYECEKEAAAAQIRSDLRNACLRAKGWRGWRD